MSLMSRSLGALINADENPKFELIFFKDVCQNETVNATSSLKLKGCTCGLHHQTGLYLV